MNNSFSPAAIASVTSGLVISDFSEITRVVSYLANARLTMLETIMYGSEANAIAMDIFPNFPKYEEANKRFAEFYAIHPTPKAAAEAYAAELAAKYGDHVTIPTNARGALSVAAA